jgi:rhodanese-related sulfurtransferase
MMKFFACPDSVVGNKLKKVLSPLFLTLLLSISSFVVACVAPESIEVVDVTPLEATELISQHLHDTNFTILDIRTPDEFSSGHLPEALNIDYYSTGFREQLDGLSKTNAYLLYCRTGNRSGKTLEILKELKFKKVYHLVTGVVGWQSAGFSLVK